MTYLEQIVQEGFIPKDKTNELRSIASTEYNGDIDLALIKEFGVDAKALLSVKSKFFGIPARLIDPAKVTTDVLKFIPYDSAKHYQFVPLEWENDALLVGIVDPDNIEARDALNFITSQKNVPFKLFLISPVAFEEILERYSNLRGEVDQALSDIADDVENVGEVDDLIIEQTNIQNSLNPTDEKRIVEEAPIIKIVSVILHHAVEGNASDIHIENSGEQVKVRFRVDGTLHTSLLLPLNVFSGIVARIKVMARMRLDEKRKPQDSSFTVRMPGKGKIDFRVSTFPTYYGEKVVMRILDSNKGVRSISELGLSEHNTQLVTEALARPFGMILLTGPTGSGKTTTLYAMLHELDREKKNVVSLEDPVEYQIESVSQSQIMPQIGYTFASGLRSILRQDPDVIMVGEIRDKETAQLAIQAALTGHLVFSTLHTNSAAGVVPRLVDMGIDPYLIAPTLNLAIAQRLVRRTCPGAEEKIPIDKRFREVLNQQFQDLPDEFLPSILSEDYVHKAIPTPECPSGTRDRVAVFEMFAVDDEMKNVILNNPVDDEIQKVARKKGMLTMREDAIIKTIKGEIPFEDVYNV